MTINALGALLLLACLIIYAIAFVVLKHKENKEIDSFNKSTKSLNDNEEGENSEDRSM